jgi:hypothetical protein
MADNNAQAPATEQPTTTEQPGMYFHCCEARISSVQDDYVAFCGFA